MLAVSSRKKYQKIVFAVRVLQRTQNLSLVECGYEMYKDLKKSRCIFIVPLIKPFVW